MVRKQPIDVILCVITVIGSFILLCAAAINVRNQCIMIGRNKLLDYARWLTLVCTVFQLFIFIGYWLENYWVIQIGWNAWVPLSLLDLCVLSTKIIEMYQLKVKKNSDKTTSNSKFCDKLKLYHSACVLVTLFIWIGTIVYKINDNNEETSLFYGLYKLCGALLLVFPLYFLYKTINTICEEIQKTTETGELQKLQKDSCKLKTLWCVLMVIMLFLLGYGVTQVIYFAIHKKNDSLHDYTHVELWQLFLIYFPLISLVSIFNILYTWMALPKNQTEISDSNRLLQVQ